MKRLFVFAAIVIASLTISNNASAQVRLGLSNSTRLSSAASVSTPSVNNALRASAATTHAAEVKTTHAAATTTHAAATTTHAAASTAKSTTATAEATKVDANASASANASTSVAAGKQ
ncbi:hypothetical protein ACQ86N_47015 [Puia sp. P3]|uniref:hypothetical protein n=1 Tax=Puia sp. P3 TaxID=3423952 RepID=UPI003D67A660